MDSRLARRLRNIQPSATVSITARAIELRNAGRDIISLSVGEPDFDTPTHIKAAAIAAIEAGYTKYTALDGARDLKLAIQRKFKRDNQLQYGLDQILVSNGAKQSCYNLCQAVLEPGHEAIVLAPYWVSYPDMVGLSGALPVTVSASAGEGFKVRAEQLAAAITPATRLLILNSPSNPTGAVYSRLELEELGTVVRANPDIIVLADDIYEHIRWTEEGFTSFAQACPDLIERTVTINGMSKAYAMSGWRLGYAGGPKDLISAMRTIQSQSTTNASSISQAAAVAALDGDQTCIREMCAEFKKRHEIVHQQLNAIAGIDCPRGAGAFYLFPDVSACIKDKGLADDIEFCDELLQQEGVALVPGTAFGAPNCVRVSFAASLATMDDALNRIERFVLA